MKTILLILLMTFYLSSNSQVIIDLERMPSLKKEMEMGRLFIPDTLSVYQHLRKARSDFFSKNYQEAQKGLDKAQNINPNESEIYLIKADIFKCLENYDSVICNLEKAIDLFETGYPLKTSPYGVYNQLGTVYLKNQQYQNAENKFNKALEYSYNPNALYNRGVSKLHLGKTVESCNDLYTAKKMGIEQADKIMKTWCKDCQFSEVISNTQNYPENALNYYQPDLDTFQAKIYFNHDWDIVQFDRQYKRNCKWIKSQQAFEGHFIDYRGNNRYAEGYYKNGKKNGLYIKYYDGGAMEAMGNFKDDQPWGFWNYYHPNQMLKMVVSYKGGLFDVKAYYDENGNQLLKDGYGKWQYSFQNNRLYVYTLKGQYKNYKRVGTWTLDCNPCAQQVIEKYSKDGEYKSTKTNIWHHSNKDKEIFFNSWILMELRHYQIIKLQYNNEEVFTAYPFFNKGESMTKAINDKEY